MKKKLNSRTIFIIANSSWYINHYRKYLLKELKRLDLYNVVTISPYDNYSKYLSKLSLNIPWRISRSGNKNLFQIIFSLVRLIFIFRSLKPKIVHSHTLKTNFLTSITSFIFGTQCIISFAGLGQISNSKGIKKLIFILILKIIGFLSYREIKNQYISNNKKRTAFIFQNRKDMKFIKKIIKIPPSRSHLILGSGLPNYFLEKSNPNDWITPMNNWLEKETIFFNLIYLGRLLKSKGILTFIEIANLFDESYSSIYGSIDSSSNDSLTKSDLKKLNKKNKNITFKGFIKDPLLNNNSNYPILVVPSTYGEGLPRGIIEALALRIPVVCSKKATCNLFDQSLLYISADSDLISYKNCITRIFKDYKEGRLKNKLNDGKKYVEENLLESKIVEQTISVYYQMEK